MSRLSRTLTAATLAAAAFAALTAQAASVTVTFDANIFNGTPSPGYDQVKISFPKESGSGSESLTVNAGRFQGTASHLVDIEPGRFVDSVSDLWMYCYDLYETIGNGQVVTYTVNFAGVSDRTLDFLGAVNAVRNAGKATLDPYAWLHPATAYEAAAIQLGIWESKYDTGWNIGSGAFSASGLEAGTASALASYFAAIPTAASLDRSYTMVLEARGAQDMITGDPPPDNNVPEPGTLALVLGPVALLALRRRRQRAHSGA
ncbi:MAG: PEP-CTERM sorting domain-containing protein [Proteobacteria bacterium]|jgi:hypothetical protein|nr:PEP-CTERM sorting domain-containing protein [Pseudomonadota bacterium]